MISHGKVPAKSSLNGDKCANPPQAPMTLQNTGAFSSHELHPQTLIQLVGCRLLDAQQEKPKITSR
jgi:hypothetical protein